MLAIAVAAGLGHGPAYGGAHGVVETIAVGDRAAGLTATAYVVYQLARASRRSPSGVPSPRSPNVAGVATGALAGLLLAATVAAWCLTRCGLQRRAAASTGGRRRRQPASATSPPSPTSRGIHLANGILHGRRAGDRRRAAHLPGAVDSVCSRLFNLSNT
ncbi:hypothetical protein HBB16_07630 [Pseudonocardia sp. MCCB 268]|nr:hypothetical protein [Pseudonocardia cytotoxica]